MNAYVLVYIFLAVALAGMVYVVGMPWITPKPRKISRRRPHEHGIDPRR